MKGSRRIGRYRVLRELARGGQGVVFLGEDLGGNEVAIKLLLTESEEQARRFELEAQAAAAGVGAVLAKPLDRLGLARAVRTALDQG